ncbi:MAG TPA: penicillin acylase family protein [Terriglobales bacterium]|nr:penicillin acylase family protein [Terriglobales bacterium]
MSVATMPISPPRRRLRFWRIAAVLVALLLLAALGAAAWFWSAARSALPRLDGTLLVSGLVQPVIVSRDGHGVPTITASSISDLFFAQGFVTAQDRLWQMDMMRRAAAGQLAELLGPEYVEHDREQRILGLREAAQKMLEVSTAEDRARFQAYARGVNAYIALHHECLPLEFRILGYLPDAWKAEDSTLIAAQMIEELTTSPKQALVREKILPKLGPELTADLYVNSSWHDRPPTAAPPSFQPAGGSDEVKPPPATAVTRNRAMPRASALPAELPLVEGSNNWVISGAHTLTGKPLLSNDMHLGHQMPNLWYEVHLRGGGLEVAGVSLPGMPYVIVGHNQRIAWGFTNIGPTVEDAYIEIFNSQGQYLTPQGWQAPQHRREAIHVKGNPDVIEDVVITRHGPIVTPLAPGETRKIALRWTLYDGIRNPFFDLDSAQNWEQFRAALSHFDAPSQNVVYADVDGNIGYQATGKIPIRAAGDGSLPENGADDAHEWTGYIPFDKMPSLFNPPSGILATANGRITPDGYPYSISTEWEAPWRAERIYRVLESGKKFSAADMLQLETDVSSAPDRYFAEQFVYAVDHARNPSPRARQAADLMRGWDGQMAASSPAPTLETRSRTELARLLLEAKLGPEPRDARPQDTTLNWTSYRWGMQSVWLENVLLHQPPRWLPANFPNYTELLAAAVEAAVGAPDAPHNLASWNWGNFNPVEIQHPIFGHVPILELWTGPGTQPQSGSGFTVKAVTRHHGPSERMTVDLSDLDQSTLNLVTGEAGNFLSPYYMDQWKAWYGGFTFRLPFSARAVARAQAHHLVLAPN